MLIKSLSMKNFQCYSGDHIKNTLDFTSGINLIIGNNGAGKSKLFDAFYWLLKDEIFDSEKKKFISTPIYKEGLISDKAKALCIKGVSVDCEVQIIATDQFDKNYRITRLFQSKYLGDDQWQSNSNSSLRIYKKVQQKWQIVGDENHPAIMSKLIVPRLQPYMWFQGEQVDGLMDFTNEHSLKKAIDLLSQIDHFDKLVEISSIGQNKADREYNLAAKRVEKNATEIQKSQDEEERYSGIVKNLSNDLELQKSELKKAQAGKENLLSSIEDASKKKDAETKLERLERERKELQKEYSLRTENLSQKILSESWTLMGTLGFSQKFHSQYSSFLADSKRIKHPKNLIELELPKNVPEPVHVNRMLEEEKCMVCGRDAKKGTSEYRSIESLLRKENPQPDYEFENDCSALFTKLYQSTLKCDSTDDEIKEKIKKEIDFISQLDIKLEENGVKIQDQNDILDGLVSISDAGDIINSFSFHDSNAQELIQRIEQTKAKHKKYDEHREALSRQVKRLVSNQVTPKIIEAKEIWETLKKVSKTTRTAVFQSIVDELENEGNEIFQRMVKDNHSITGKLRLSIQDDQSVLPEIVDSNGSLLRNNNASNIILIKLALMMAVINSRETFSQHFCMVTDAPTAKMSREYSNGFYDALGNNFKQSIVMTYDFLDAENESYKNLNLGKVYKITADYPNGDRTDRSDLSVRISEVKK